MSIVKEIWAFLKIRKKFWLAPIIIALVLLGGLARAVTFGLS